MPWLALPLLVLYALVARAFRRAPPPDEPRAEPGLALLAGVAGTALAAFVFVPAAYEGWALTASDFGQYCQATWAAATGDAHFAFPQRSAVAARLPGLLARRLGIVDGLAVQALLASVLLHAALYSWARLLHGRLAGVAAVLFAAAMPPLAELSRTLSFYPASTAVFALGGASCAALLLRPGPAPALAAGTGAALGLMIDVRGLTYGLAFAGLGALGILAGALRAPAGGRAPSAASLLLFLTPVALSWPLAGALLPEATPGLQPQVSDWLRDACALAGRPCDLPPLRDFGFVWGRSPPESLPGALAWLLHAGAGVPAEVARAGVHRAARATLLGAWLPLGLLLLPAAWAMGRRAAALLPALPFLLAALTAARLLPRSHYLAPGFVIGALLLGLGFAGLVEGRSRPGRPRRGVALLAPFIGAGLLALALLGALPSGLGPDAAWRPRWGGPGLEPRATLLRAATGAEPTRPDGACLEALQAAHAGGHPYGSRLYGLVVEER